MIRGMIRGYDSRKSNILPLLKRGHVKKRHSHILSNIFLNAAPVSGHSDLSGATPNIVWPRVYYKNIVGELGNPRMFLAQKQIQLCPKDPRLETHSM